MKIIWDERKRRSNLQKHGMDFADLDLPFFAGAKLAFAKAGRLVAVGEFEGRLATVVFLPLGSEAISIISFRTASRKERRS